MSDSGARGNISNFTQLVGMRGLMSNPKGETIELPIKSALREGLTASEFFISTHGARKGSTDTALKTADSGYLTRRLVDVAQEVIITEDDCHTDKGFEVSALINTADGNIIVPLVDRLVGRTSLKDIVDPATGEIIVHANELMNEKSAKAVSDAGIKTVEIRNIFGCKSKNGICRKCYGLNLATGQEVLLGETIGIMGGTGSAKSSFVNLLSRLYDVEKGRVIVGGKDVREYDLDVLRKEVSVVLQKNVLFSGTILENLRWGDENATDEECIRACKLACADEFIEQFPDKYDTHIEQGGTNVSGGQKQRLCIARALLKKPKILILDDSTSAVDTKTDAIIRAGFKKFIPETTKIIIAQRVSSVQDADQIIIMNNGSVEAIGTHDELLASNPIYQEVYYSQNKGGEQDEK